MFVGFPLGGLLSLSIMARAAVLLGPAGIEVDQLSQVAIPVALGAGRLGLAVVIAGFFAVTFGTAMETSDELQLRRGPVLGWQCAAVALAAVRSREMAAACALNVGCIPSKSMVGAGPRASGPVGDRRRGAAVGRAGPAGAPAGAAHPARPANPDCRPERRSGRARGAARCRRLTRSPVAGVERVASSYPTCACSTRRNVR